MSFRKVPCPNTLSALAPLFVWTNVSLVLYVLVSLVVVEVDGGGEGSSSWEGAGVELSLLD